MARQELRQEITIKGDEKRSQLYFDTIIDKKRDKQDTTNAQDQKELQISAMENKN